MKILALAFTCEPPSGGAFRTCQALAKRDDLEEFTIVSSENLDIEEAKETTRIDVDVVRKPLEGIARWFPQDGTHGQCVKTALSFPLYIVWELMVWKRYRTQLEAGEFDLIFRASPVSPALPSPIARRSPVPFVVGPVNGCLKFEESADGDADWMQTVTDLRGKLPYRQSTYDNTDAILAAHDHTIRDLPETCRERAILFPEAGYDPERFYPPEHRSPAEGPMRFIAVGSLTRRSSVEILVRAFIQFPELRKHHLTIVGSGSEERALRKLIERHDLSSCVSLTGRLEQKHVASALRASDVFVSPSTRQLSGTTMIEAMASGLPCIGTDQGAHKNLISAERGLKIPPAPRDRLVADFGTAMLKLAGDPERTQALGIAALDYAEGFGWDRKSKNIVDVFKWVMGELDDKPEFY